jgi:hypothetical protein
MKKIILIISVSLTVLLSCHKETVRHDSQATNHPPVAKAGNDTTIILPANSCMLDGSASTDPDNNIESYLWTKISGPSSYSITNENAAQTQIKNLTEGVYLFELKVTDAGGLFAKANVLVTVTKSTSTPLIENVYIAGFDEGTNLWKNGVSQSLPTGSNGYANSVYVSDSNVYVAGNTYNATSGHGVAALWKNGVVQNLTDGTTDAWATSVFVSGTDVYVTGIEQNAAGIHSAMLWKNGVSQKLADSTEAISVFVSGNDVYVAGSKYNDDYGYIGAILWKNGVAQNLTNGTGYFGATSVTVSGSDVYVTGFNGHKALLWKNGVEQFLTDGSHEAMALSVFLWGSDVYVTGYETNTHGYQVAKLWINGVSQDLSDGYYNAEAYSVFIFGRDVYVAGYDGYAAMLWKNGVAQNLSSRYSVAYARSVFVGN